jgi:TPR repeat protein
MNDKFEKFISCIENEFILIRVDSESITRFLSKKYNELLVEKTTLLNYLIKKESKTSFERYFLAIHCLYGIDGISHDVKVAFGKITSLVEARYPPALFALAVIYNEGIAGEFDQNKVFDLFFQGYKLGFLPSYCALARCYSWGCGTLQDKAKAISIFEEAINLGYTQAEFSYGEELITQICASEAIYQKGLKLIFCAAGKGNIDAIKFIARALCGYSRFKDIVADYIKANKHGNDEIYPVAEFLVYYRHISPSFAVPKQDPAVEEVAIKLLMVLDSYPQAVKLLAYCYQEGIGVPADAKKSCRLLCHVRTKVPNSGLSSTAIPLNESVLPKVVDESNLLRSVIEIYPPTPPASPTWFCI